MSTILLESGDAILLESGDALLTEAPAPTGFRILLESGDALLLESGDALLLEEDPAEVLGTALLAMIQSHGLYCGSHP
jgi:hypothetical protein